MTITSKFFSHISMLVEYSKFPLNLENPYDILDHSR